MTLTLADRQAEDTKHEEMRRYGLRKAEILGSLEKLKVELAKHEAEAQFMLAENLYTLNHDLGEVSQALYKAFVALRRLERARESHNRWG
jgi:hypothetical protein